MRVCTCRCSPAAVQGGYFCMSPFAAHCRQCASNGMSLPCAGLRNVLSLSSLQSSETPYICYGCSAFRLCTGKCSPAAPQEGVFPSRHWRPNIGGAPPTAFRCPSVWLGGRFSQNLQTTLAPVDAAEQLRRGVLFHVAAHHRRCSSDGMLPPSAKSRSVPPLCRLQPLRKP